MSENHPDREVRRFGRDASKFSQKTGRWMRQNWGNVIHHVKVGIIENAGGGKDPTAIRKLNGYYQTAERLRERAWRLYQKEPARRSPFGRGDSEGELKDALGGLHHDLAAFSNSIDNLVVNGSTEPVTASGMRRIIEKTAARKFRNLNVSVKVSRSVPADARLPIDHGSMALLLDNLAENAEKAARSGQGRISLTISQNRRGELVILLRNSVRKLDDATFRKQRLFYRQVDGFSGAFHGASGTGIVYSIGDLFGGKTSVWRRRASGGGWVYSSRTNLPLAKAA